MFVNQSRARLARLQHVVNRRKLFEVQCHGCGDVFGLGSRRRHAHGDQFSDVADLAGRQHRLL